MSTNVNERQIPVLTPLGCKRIRSSFDTGMEYCDPCHYRTAANSGIGCKPEFSCIPLRHAQHLEQHRVGQFNFMPREWWEEMTELYLQRWIAI